MEEYKYVEIRGRGKFISRNGDAYNPKRINQPATIHMNSDGYPCFGGGIPVHLYVAHAWVPGYYVGAEVDHIDSNRMNYSADNLRWVSHDENIKHAAASGNMKRYGERNSRAIETNEQVERIRKLYDSGMKVADIMKVLRPDINRNVDINEYKRVHKRFNRIAKRETW